ncbi:MAG: hypothetical protein EXR75_01815 [Myxococcales bacterium]|nr:hypothetical protein [Myxococcales bacterium]
MPRFGCLRSAQDAGLGVAVLTVALHLSGCASAAIPTLATSHTAGATSPSASATTPPPGTTKAPSDSQSPAPPGAIAARATASETPFGQTGAQASARIELRRFQLAVTLPDPDGWRTVKAKSRFIELVHERTVSRLLVGVFSETARMSRAGCEESARRYRELPPRRTPLSSTRALVPRGFDTEATALISTSLETGHAAGDLLAFGASGRECFVFVFTTSSEGPDAARQVEDRLAWIESATLRSLTREQRLAIDPRDKQ